MVEAVRISKERAEPVVRALRALGGVDLIVAVTFTTEIGDVRRFDSPRQLTSYLGLLPSERSSGETIRRGGLTKAGNGRVCHMLVRSAWTYRHLPRIGKAKLYRLDAAPTKVREIACKAQTRLTARNRALSAREKRRQWSARRSLASSSAAYEP
jgi:transposase